MSIYAEAINSALGVEEKPSIEVGHVRKTAPAAGQALRDFNPGRLHGEVHLGVHFVVREFGAASFSRPPFDCLVWTPYFSDDELTLAPTAENFEARIEACRRAIEREAADKPCAPVTEWQTRKVAV